MRGRLLALFRRDRLTGQLAVGLVGVLVVSALVYGVGLAGARYDLSDVGAWLSAEGKGLLVHANGPAAKVDGRTAIPKGMRGHRIKIIQDGSTTLIVDLETGVVGRLDPSQLTVDRTRAFGRPNLQLVTGAGRAYAVDAAAGTVQQIDPLTLAAVGSQSRFTPPLDQSRVDSRGTLWVPVPQSGQVVPFTGAGPGKAVQVGEAGARLALTTAAGQPVVVDPAAATATVLDPSGTPLKLSLPSTVRGVRPADVLVPPLAEGRTVPVLAGSTLLVFDADTGRSSSTPLPGAKHRYGAPQVLGPRVYLPDETAGALLVYDTTSGTFQQRISVSGRSAPLEVFVKDGLLWANDPAGDRAVVVNRDGGVGRIEKYDTRVPGGKRRPLPAPGGAGDQGERQGDGGDRGGQTPAPPSPTRTPTPEEPPLAPTAPTVESNAGTIRVRFAPSVGGKPTGYVLKDVPAGLTATPQTIASDAGDHTFTVTGGQCAQEYRFRVAVRYRNRQGKEAERVSPPSPPVRPCIPPGTPSNAQATATTQGARLTWAAPPEAKDTTYKVSWRGPATGTQDNVTGTTLTLPTIATNGTYTFEVTAKNAAGTSKATTFTTKLTGPTGQYAVANNGKSTGYIHSDTNANTKGDVVAEMFDNNGEMVTVLCQAKGTHYAHPTAGAAFSGDMYIRMTYKGTTGHIIGYLIKTPNNWKTSAAPTIWKC